MSLKLRKRVKIAPGIYINLSASKRGLTSSASVGVPGMNMNIGKKKDGTIGSKRGTFGIPDSGVRYDADLDDSTSLASLERCEDGELESQEERSNGFNIYWWLTLACVAGLVALNWSN